MRRQQHSRPLGGRHKRRKRAVFDKRKNVSGSQQASSEYKPRRGKKYDVKSGGPKKV